MDRVATIDDRISVLTYPPEADDLKELANAGFKTVINLRSAGEGGEVLSPDAEAIESRGLGLQYLHFPLSPADLTHASAKELARELEKLPVPAAIHCASGRRASLMGLASWAQQVDCSDAATAAKRGREAGLQVSEADLSPLIKGAGTAAK